ncbi:hypothetical protein CHS0354_032613 [Potamilus streckersoni]|uniref:mitogen-activated protein kinase kinase n=1 Tax=Potamilus streckersoni TaxID=2493646 RepID=A0AAE0W8R7_9BIVA|nr:hypothetical protein CHS0354_032613 [Potamilus streckersoni]
MLSEDDVARGLLPPFIIYPRVGKTPNMRNKYGLTIRTPKSASDTLVKTQSSLMPQAHLSEAVTHNQGGAGAGGDIKEILACGQITETDLQILQLLGSGNGGKVYRAIHIPSQQQMAVKVTELGVAVDVQKQIISELEILYKCQSPAIITFYGAYFKENRISMCTEFMDGGSLDKYGQVPETVLGRMAVFIVQGLLYMWNLKILHRDIKPSNILVSTRGEVKLCDFGVSAQLIKSIAETYVGTNAYMSPERIRADTYGISSDVWSLGVSLFELATGHFPFKLPPGQGAPRKLFELILEGTSPTLPEGTFSPYFIDFVARCMQKHHIDRIMPQDITAHPFIQQYSDGNTSIIAAWVQAKLSQMQNYQTTS